MDDDTVIDLITDFLRSRNLVHTAECLEQERDVLLHQIPHANGNTVNYKSSILEQLLVEGRRSLFVDRDGVQVSAEVERSKQLYYESKAKSPKIMTNNHHHGNEKEVDWNFLKKSSAATVVDEDRAYFDDEESDEIILRPQLNVTESSPSLQKEEIEDSNAESQNSKLSRNEQFWRSNSVSSARSSKSMSFVESGSDREVDVDVGVATPNDLPSEDEARDADEWVDEEDPGYFKIPFGEYYEDVESDEDFEFNSNYYPAEPKQEQQESPFNQFLSNTQGEATSTPISAASSRNSLQSFKSPIIDSKSSIQQISNESPSTKDLYVEGGKLIYEGDGKRSIFQLEIVEEPDDGLSEDNNDNDNDGNEDEDPYSVTESHEWDSSAFSEVSSQGVQSLTSSSQNFLNSISSPYKTDDNSKLSPLLNHIQQQNNAQGVTNKSNGITQQNNINDSFTNEDFEVERLNEILRDHIQLRRDEFYQENYNPSVASNNNINNNNVIGNTGNAAQGSDIQRLWDSKEQENELFPKTETLPSLENFFPAKEVTTNKFQELTPESTPTHTKNQHSLDNLDFHEESKPQEIQYESFNLPIIYQKGRTGLEETKDFPIIMNSVIASRYQILDFLGSAAFSTAVKCLDLITGQQVCVKIIKNNKEFLDQSLDEIKLLMFINSNIDPDEKHVLQLYDYFYHREHLFIVSELLRENLYEFYKFNRESGDAIYFTIDRIKLISKQLLIALQFIHNLSLIHADLKPENILIKSYSRCEVKMIDFGSSCFTRDHLSSYVQSRSYRAPEVILGLPYDQRIDIWSLGCILAELWSGRVLFQNESIATLLARVVSILGPFEIEMLQCARHANKYFTKSNTLYDRTESGQVFILKPKRTSLKSRLKCDDDLFIDFVSYLLTLRPDRRPTATEALQHPFLSEN